MNENEEFLWHPALRIQSISDSSSSPEQINTVREGARWKGRCSYFKDTARDPRTVQDDSGNPEGRLSFVDKEKEDPESLPLETLDEDIRPSGTSFPLLTVAMFIDRNIEHKD